MHHRILAHLAIVALVAIATTGGAALAADPAPPHLALELGTDGVLAATGTLPPGVSPEALRAALPGVDVSGIADAATGPAWQVAPALEALSIVLPRFRTAEVRLSASTLAIEGTLNSGLSAAGVQAALRAALGPGWQLDLQLSETAPAAELVVSRAGEDIAASGLLPHGLDPPEALKLLDPAAAGLGLAAGGEGNPQDWSAALSALGGMLDHFASARARVATGEVAIEGVLRPGYPRAAVADRIEAALPEGWRVVLEARETPPSEGDRRVSLDSGMAESFRRGYWLPEVSFPVSPDRCAAETAAALSGEGLPFVESGAEIEERGLPLLDRLAAIAVRCLNSSSLRLEIGGHTDSVGNDATNEALSRARAQAVRQALVDRGVREESVTARGYGEARPVATNNTPEGRARNRRIAFDWSDPRG